MEIHVVDNDPGMLRFMKDFLEKKGHRVETSEDGLSALHTLKNAVPDVMFVDLIMPNIDGKKLCQVIRKVPRLKDIYLVVLSAIAAEEDLDFARFGANAGIVKSPFNIMAKNVQEILAQYGEEKSTVFHKDILGLEEVRPRAITKELLSVKRHFEVILGNMSEGILEITRDSKIVYANHRALSILNLPEELLLSTNLLQLFAEHDRERIKELLEHPSDPSYMISEDVPISLDGRKLSVKISELHKEEANTIIILNDVSERKLLESKIQEAQKMQAIGTLAGGIAHDFNNLLTAIQGNLSLMLLDMEPAHPHHKKLDVIEQQVQNASKLTGQLLGYARKGRYEIRPIDLNTLVRDTSETFGRTKKEINIHYDLEKGLFGIEADQSQVEQVLLNLFVNAADAMPGGGDLYLKTMNITDMQLASKPYRPKPGKYVMLKVRDNGLGMDEVTKKRIFEPFFTTKEMGRGTGLGLASVYGIIKGHGGFIEIESEEKKGSTFNVMLPASGTVTLGQIPKKSKEIILPGSETILLVDDEEVVRTVGQEILEAMGYRVLSAKDGEEALDIYKLNIKCVDIILLDMVMPDMGGSEAYDKLKEINPDAKVLLSSGYSLEGEATEIMNRGCDGFIQKPFEIGALSRSLRRILDGEKGGGNGQGKK